MYTKIFLLTTLIAIILDSVVAQQYSTGNTIGSNILDIEPPKFYIINPSPLRNPESLRQQQYYSFLNTLYRNDRSKSNLFENIPGISNSYPLQHLRRQKRSISASAIENEAVRLDNRAKRAVVFRPLFVYRQQEVKRQRLAEQRRRRYRH